MADDLTAEQQEQLDDVLAYLDGDVGDCECDKLGGELDCRACGAYDRVRRIIENHLFRP